MKDLSSTHASRVQEVRALLLLRIAKKTDRLFAYLFIFQWLAGIAFALWISPQTWSGEFSATHIHVYAAACLGGLLAALPVYLALTNPGAPINRMVGACSQILFSILFIHLTGGRVETHFHIFGSLAFLAFYRDWRTLLIGTGVTIADHLFRGAIWPQSVYGTISASPWRALEHGGWVLFEDVILLYSIQIGLSQIQFVAQSQVKQEELIANIEDQVNKRTHDLQEAQKIVMSQQASLMASAKLSALGEMAGGVAHEINNPLTIILGKAGLMRRQLEQGRFDIENLKVELAKIEDTSIRIAKIIKGLRAFSRNAEKDPMENFPVSQIIEDTLELCREKLRHHSIELKINCPPELFCECRPSQITQVLTNLLSNAYDAVEQLSEKWVHIEASSENGLLKIEVTDSGNGIPPQIALSIMHPFFTTKDIGKGTGLGLSISQGIIKDHQGKLYYDASSKNTRFVVVLPVHQGSTHSKKEAA